MEQETVIIFFVLLLAALIGAIPAMIASDRGVAGNGFLWWLAGMLLFPIALLAALLMKPDLKLLEKQKLEEGGSKKCPQCAELVKKEALKCRFCNYDFAATSFTAANKKCLACGEILLKEAARCRFCGHQFPRARPLGIAR